MVDEDHHPIIHKGQIEICSGMMEIYRRAFAPPPWGEGRVCALCGRQFPGLEPQECCGEQAGFCWTDDKVTAALAGAHRHSLLAVVDIDRITVGLAAAEVITVADLRQRMRVVDLFPGHCATSRLIYLADMAVDPEWQGRGIGRLLFAARQRCIEAQGHGDLLQYVRVRRHPTASVTHTWYATRNARLVYEYPPEDGRVILHVDPEKVCAARSA